MDANRPPGDDEAALLCHLRGRTSAVPAIGIERRVQIFDLSMHVSKGRITLKSRNGDQICIDNDVENSGLYLLDTVLARLLERKVDSPVAVSMAPFARVVSINSKRYYDTDKPQYSEYIRRLGADALKDSISTYQFAEVINHDTGIPRAELFKPGSVIYLTTPPPTDDIEALMEACDANKAGLEFPVTQIGEIPRIMAKWNGVQLASERRLSYTPKGIHPAAPLVTGHECPLARDKYLVMLENWIKEGIIVPRYELLDPTVVVDEVKKIAGKPTTNLVAEQKETLDVKQVDGPPEFERALFIRALTQPPQTIKKFLEDQGYSMTNGDIWNMQGTHPAPPVMLQGCKEACQVMFEMSAIDILKRVHWALTNKELYDAEVFAHAPKQPWLAAIVLVCRKRGTYKVERYRYVKDEDDLFPPTDARVRAALDREADEKKKEKEAKKDTKKDTGATSRKERTPTPGTSGQNQRKEREKTSPPPRKTPPKPNEGPRIKYLQEKPGSSVVLDRHPEEKRTKRKQRRGTLESQLAAMSERIEQIASMRMAPAQPACPEGPPMGANGGYYYYAPNR